MESSQVPILMQALRQVLRAHGLRYRDIAEKLHVGERTVARWMTSEKIDTSTIEDLCSLIDMTFFDLCEFVLQRSEEAISQLTLQQEQELAGSNLLQYFFMQLLKNWPVEDIRRELELSEPELINALIRLEKVGLIDLLPQNRVRLRVAKKVKFRPSGPFLNNASNWVRDMVADFSFAEPHTECAIEAIKLSPASRAALRPKFERLLDEARELGDLDRRTNSDSRDWYACILIARPYKVSPYRTWSSTEKRKSRSPRGSSTQTNQ
jgi:transcriptional regulator with XRE-family HTH domain